MDSRTTRCWYVEGKVQGVGFRAFVRRHALRLNLVGYARNIPDGRVEIVAYGSPRSCDALERYIRRGPRRARVEAIIDGPPDDESAIPGYRGFAIR